MFIKTILTVLLVISSMLNVNAGDTIKLFFAGDFMQHLPQINSAKCSTNFNYETNFRYIQNVLKDADIAAVNLEAPLAGKPYSGFPLFSAPEELAFALKDHGFDLIVTANNHSCDQGSNGINRTVKMLDSAEIMHTGIFINAAQKKDKYPLIFEKNNFKFAVLNYTYGTNKIKVPHPCIVNLIDSTEIHQDIINAKKHKPDLMIVFIHWGEEYERLQDTNQKKLAEFMFSQGVNLIIGAHPHVIQPMEKRYNANGNCNCNKLVAYSLGNFISNQPFTDSDGGALLHITAIKDEFGINLKKTNYSLIWVYKPKNKKQTDYYILPSRFENNRNFMDENNYNKMNNFFKRSRELLNQNNIGIVELKF